MRKVGLLAAALGVLGWWVMPAAAAETQPFKPQVFYPVKFDVSKPLRDVKLGKPMEMGKPREVVNRPIPKVQPGAGGKYDTVQNAPGRQSTPNPLLTFQGLDSDDNQNVLGFRVMPPDTEGDVGPNHYFEWINLVFQIYDKSGNPQLPNPLPGNSFWSGFGGLCETENDGDPIVLYDHTADRWFVQQFSITSPYRLCIALSQTNDPTGSYYRWEYVFNNNKFPDYPKVGVWHDAYYVGFNQFLNASSWAGAGVLALQKAAMVQGNSNPVMIYFDLYSVNPNYGNMFPAHLEGTLAGTPPGIFAEWDDAGWLGDPNDTLRIWYFTPNWTTPSNSTFGINGNPNELVATADIDPDMCGFNRNCIPQQGTTQMLDAISDRLMYRIQFRDFGTYQVLLTAQTVDADGTDHAGVHWRELRSDGTYANYSVYQEGTYAPDANHRWMGSAAMDASGNICVGYSISSASMYPSAGYACRESGDPLGQLGNEVIYRIGTGYQGGGNRWGDYSTMSVDPTDQCTFWTAQEYGRASGSFYWSTAIASFKMPSCVTGPSGTVHGTVTSSATGLPLGGVQVQAVGTNTYQTNTNNSGQYSMVLPPDTYDITFSKFGYNPFTQTGQVVNNDDDITLNVALTPEGNAELDGYVTGQAHGWPLYAKVVAKVSGNPVGETYTDPFTGYYCFCAPNDLPHGYTYTLEVTSQIPGYLPATDTILLPPTGATKNFVLADDGSADWVNCVLQGGLNEDFEGDFPPPGWKVEVYNANTNNNWRRNDQWGRANVVPGGTGYAAGADSAKAGSGSGAFDTALVTPWIQMPANTRELAFDHKFWRYYASDRAYVDVCVAPCTSWTNLQTFTSDNQQPQTISLAGYEGQTIKLRFRYVSGDWAWYWYIDNVRTQTPAVPPPPPSPQWTENFDGATPPNLPTGWAQVAVSGTAGNWATATATHHPSGNPPYSAPNLAYFNSWHALSGNSTRLYKTTFDNIPSGQTGFVGLWMYHDLGYSSYQDRVQVQYSTDGVNWNNAGNPIYRYDGSTGWSYHLVELTGASGNIYIGLLGISSYGNDVHIDDVEFLLGQPGTPPSPDTPSLNCSPVAGTLVEGFVTDQNTGLPVLGATVTNHETQKTGITAATPDPNLPDGFYWLFVPQPGNGPGTRTFTATKTGYGPANASANLPPNTTFQIDFALPAGWLVVTPTSLFSRLYTGQSETQYLTLDNQGGMPVIYSLFVLPQANTWPHYSPVRSGSVPHTPASLGRAPSIQQPNYGNFKAPYLASVEAYAVELYPGGALRYWPDLTAPGTANTVGTDPNSDFGGDFVLGDFSKLYVLDYGNNELAYLDTTTAARTVVGSAVPSFGHVWTGMAASPTGTIYASAADPQSCSASSLYTIDKNTGAATLIGTITNAPCVINLAIDPAGQWLYAVDIVNDNLVRIDPNNAAGTVVGSVGINANYAQGMDFDDFTGTLYWAAYSGSGELRVLDTITGASTLVGAFPSGAEIDALATKTFAGGVCWLTLNPDTGSVPANSQVTVDANFQATSSCPPLYGSHRATISVVNNTAYPVTNPTVCFYRAFNDVPQGHMFDKFIHALAGGGITQGFGGNFDPTTNIQRHVMARWLLKARYGSSYVPPSCTGIFADVDCENTPNADYIEDAYNKGISGGCSTSPLQFCPNGPVKRNQMAVFLLRANAPDPTTYTPPACTGIFSDVACPGTFADWIEELYNQGITSGCGGGKYCPSDFVRRDQMSKFLVKTFSIPTCP